MTSALLTLRKVAQRDKRVQRFRHPRRVGPYVLTECLHILDMDGLKTLASNTRRPVGELEPRGALPPADAAALPCLRAAA
jgi:hypothetical protein